ncbi:hypothetical protein G7Z17_g8349 [Cylindrodendrum hubeiense]|uniref:Uncharacterized protein n=1 Tax=Cylindrodendrum hubeiense TaxID=595255 RepID=A0A9P5H628_9HYPO|nr:hypothetical protein G7Z17_g8349 [Cylindrodendrum hubeiense]
MKFSTATMLALVNGIAAMPWSLAGTSKHAGALTTDEEITLHIKIAQTTKQKDVTHPSEICWKACFFVEPSCPDGWFASNKALIIISQFPDLDTNNIRAGHRGQFLLELLHNPDNELKH